METYLINQIKSDEITKGTKSDSVKSLTDLSIVELKNGNYDKAQSFSEEIIRSDSNVPAGWLLKAISEANLIEFENNYFDSSINAMSKAEEYSKKIKSVKGVIKTIYLATVVKRYSDIIKINIETSIKLEQQAAEEKKKAATAALIGAIGAGVALGSNKSLGKV
ncbi:MAG: hypothetical protein QF496_02580, partial [Dehalococcoidia bacterium]|nr:hypothetical protein [Dehalococcoidia bacterium]